MITPCAQPLPSALGFSFAFFRNDLVSVLSPWYFTLHGVIFWGRSPLLFKWISTKLFAGRRIHVVFLGIHSCLNRLDKTAVAFETKLSKIAWFTRFIYDFLSPNLLKKQPVWTWRWCQTLITSDVIDTMLTGRTGHVVFHGIRWFSRAVCFLITTKLFYMNS